MDIASLVTPPSPPPPAPLPHSLPPLSSITSLSSLAPPPSHSSTHSPLSNHSPLATLPSTLPPTHPPKRHAPSHPDSPAPKKKQSKWSPQEDAAIVDHRAHGMKWDDISRHLPGRSAMSCRLRFQNYLERRPDWSDERKTCLAQLYDRCPTPHHPPPTPAPLTPHSHKKHMWERIAHEMRLPWRAVEAMHWHMGDDELARRAHVPLFPSPRSLPDVHSVRPLRPNHHPRPRDAAPRRRDSVREPRRPTDTLVDSSRDPDVPDASRADEPTRRCERPNRRARMTPA